VPRGRWSPVGPHGADFGQAGLVGCACGKLAELGGPTGHGPLEQAGEKRKKEGEEREKEWAA
jgi:hypothetical protein